MTNRGLWANGSTLVGVATLICGLLLLAVYQGWGGPAWPGKAITSRVPANHTAARTSGKPTPRWVEGYSKLPLTFEENRGQTAREVRYVSHGSGYELFLTPREAVLALSNPVRLDLSPRHRFATLLALRKARDAGRAQQLTALLLRFEGANPEPQIVGTGEMPGKVNYFIGNDPKKWHTDVPTYARVNYTRIYPGIDLVFYGNQRRLEYDFVVAPGADPKAIRLDIEGARKLRVKANGDLALAVGSRKIEFQKPVIYQQVNGKRHEVAGRYAVVGNHRVTFAVGEYDRSEPLVLDPVLNFSTYLGGSADDDGAAIAVDSNNNVVVAGTTSSTDFPTSVNGFQQRPLTGNGVNGATAAFVTEIDPTGTQLKYSTYLAGSTPGEGAFGVDVDSTGKIYVTGFTASTDFPTNSVVAGFKPTSPANTLAGTSFITKLDPTATGASSLLYSSYIGGTNGTDPGGIGDFGQALAADQKQNGVVYVTGFTDSSPGASVSDPAGFPVVGGFQTSLSNANGNAFLSKVDTTVAGTGSLLYSTYLGGNDANFVAADVVADIGDGVATDSAGGAYIGGITYSTDLATTANATQPTYPANNTTNTGFVARIDTTQTGSPSLVYLSYLGGSGSDFIEATALGGTVANIVYVTGQTLSLDFPTTTGAFSTTGSASGKAFVTLVDTKAAVSAPPAPPVYSTFVGGTGGDDGFGIKVDSQGNAYVGGATSSIDFPLVVNGGPFQPSLAPGAAGDGFVFKLSPLGNGTNDLLYSTYFGGSGVAASNEVDEVEAIAIDTSNNAYISGHTFSTTATFPVFPTTAVQTALNGPGDAFVTKLTLIPTVTVAPTSLNFGVQPVTVTSTARNVTLTNNTSDPIPFATSDLAFNGTNAADFASPANTCGASIAAAAQCTVSVDFTPSTAAAESATLVITVTITDGGVASSQSFSVGLSGTGSASAPGVGFAPTSLSFGGQMLTTTSAAMPVTLKNTGTGALTINSIATSGDFAETSTGAGACPIAPAATLGAGLTCTINVTFSPTAVGARPPGALTVTDNAGGSPHSIPLTGTGFDFTVTATTPQAGKSPLMFNATLTSLGGFNQSVSFTCNGAPTGVTCTPAPSVTGNPAAPQPVQVTLTRTSGGLLVPPSSPRTPPLSPWQILPLLLAVMLLFLVPRAKGLRVRLGLVTVSVLLVALAGCSGASAPPVQPIKGNITITGTSSGPAGSVAHSSASVAFTLN
jgi:beta-propeller repeat-containing protein